MFMALLLCVLVSPHGSFGTELDCPACAAGLECQDLCDCQDHGAECVLDTSHVHLFHNDTAQDQSQNFVPVYFVCMTLPLNDPQWTFGLPDPEADFGSRSFAVRHLDTIILRV